MPISASVSTMPRTSSSSKVRSTIVPSGSSMNSCQKVEPQASRTAFITTPLPGIGSSIVGAMTLAALPICS